MDTLDELVKENKSFDVVFIDANKDGYLEYYKVSFLLTLNAPMATKVVCFSRLLKSLRNLYGKQCGPRSDCSYRSSLFIGAVCSRSTLFASILNSSVILGKYLQKTTSADDIFRCIFLAL